MESGMNILKILFNVDVMQWSLGPSHSEGITYAVVEAYQYFFSL